MYEITLTINALYKAEMEYNGKFRDTIGRIHHVAFRIKIYICYTSCRLETQTVASTLSGFQGIKHCIQYLDIHPHKPIFYTSNYYDGSKIVRLKSSGT